VTSIEIACDRFCDNPACLRRCAKGVGHADGHCCTRTGPCLRRPRTKKEPAVSQPGPAGDAPNPGCGNTCVRGDACESPCCLPKGHDGIHVCQPCRDDAEANRLMGRMKQRRSDLLGRVNDRPSDALDLACAQLVSAEEKLAEADRRRRELDDLRGQVNTLRAVRSGDVVLEARERRPLLFFSGASGVGKSVLAKWAAQEFGLPLRTSVNSAVYAEHKVTFEQAMADPAVMTACQREIYRRTLIDYQTAIVDGRGQVSDRGLDLVAYTADLLGAHAYADWGLEPLYDIVRRPDALVFFVRPDPAVLDVARRVDGGRRAVWLTEEIVRRIDGAIEMLLEEHRVPYLEVSGSRLKSRMNTVRRAVDLWRMPG
jgi:hypothetical protein